MPDIYNHQKFIRSVDPRMAAIAKKLGPLKITPARNHFGFLAESIINQQISVAAGLTLTSRLKNKIGTKRFTPQAILELRPAAMRRCGISASKCSYIRNAAQAFKAGGSLYKIRWSALNDAQVAQRLTAIKGIGPWTAQMFLMFALCRPDVWSPGDIALQREAGRVYKIKTGKDQVRKISKLAEFWRPYRSWAARYIWWVADGDQDWGTQ